MSWYNNFKIVAAFALILIADIVSKQIIQSSMLLHQSVPIVPGFFDITYVENPGAAFGILSTMENPWRNLLLSGISFGAILMLFIFYRKHAADDLSIKYALTMVMAGASGNLLDRFRFGVVIDFIDLHWGKYHWPAFNLADAMICLGVAILFWQLWRCEEEKKSDRPAVEE